MLSSLITAALGTWKQAEPRPVVPEDSFPKQWAFIVCGDQFILVKCSRRGGKTGGDILKAARMAMSKPGARVLYIGHIRLNAKIQFFDPLCSDLRRRGVQYGANQVDLIANLENGSHIRCMGCDDIGDVKKKLGDKWDLVIVDEAQDYADAIIDELITKAIIPTLIDRGGQLVLTFTPPKTNGGFVFRMWTDVTNGWTRFEWTLRDNPYIDSSKIAETYAKVGIGPGHPTWEREMEGRCVVDPELTVFEFQIERNTFIDFPQLSPDGWRHSMGIDLGFSDRDAIFVWGWHREDPEHRLWERWSWQENHQDVDALAKVFVDAVKTWKPVAVVGDNGGHGAVKVLKTLEQRLFGAYPIQFKPTSVEDSVALMNDDLRTGRMLLDPRGDLAREMPLVVWTAKKDDAAKRELSKVNHSDICAAARYGHHGARHYTGKAPKPELTLDQRRDMVMRERARREADPFNPRTTRAFQ